MQTLEQALDYDAFVAIMECPAGRLKATLVEYPSHTITSRRDNLVESLRLLEKVTECIARQEEECEEEAEEEAADASTPISAEIVAAFQRRQWQRKRSMRRHTTHY
jgi:hypothetical protein